MGKAISVLSVVAVELCPGIGILSFELDRGSDRFDPFTKPRWEEILTWVFFFVTAGSVPKHEI